MALFVLIVTITRTDCGTRNAKRQQNDDDDNRNDSWLDAIKLQLPHNKPNDYRYRGLFKVLCK